MKITANNKVKISRVEWEDLGRSVGWMKDQVREASFPLPEDAPSPEFEPNKMKYLIDNDMYLTFVYDDMMQRNDDDPKVLQVMFNNFVLDDAMMAEKYNTLQASASSNYDHMIKEAMGQDGQIQSYVKKVKSPKTGKEFYTLVLYGNTAPIKDYLGKPKKGNKSSGEKLYFSYYQGTWSRIIPDGFVTRLTTGEESEDPKSQSQVASFTQALETLQRGWDVNGMLFKADVSPAFDPSSYGDEGMFQDVGESSDEQKEVKNLITGVRGPEQVQKLNMFIEAELKRISEMTDEAKQSAFVKTFLKFAGEFYNYSFGNQMLIWMQKPSAEKVESRDRWTKNYGREVTNFNDAIWINIYMQKRRKNADEIEKRLRSQGKSNEEIKQQTTYGFFGVGPVYDLTATTPIPGWEDKEGNGPYEPSDWRQESNDTIEEITALIEAGIAFATAQGINVDVEQMSGSLGGYSAGGKIRINDTFDGINKFSTLVHECAHEALHWDKGKRRMKSGGEEGEEQLDNSSKQGKEIDAESTAFIVLQHYGFDAIDTPNYLAIWGAGGKEVMARKKNISESARLIIDGIDGAMKSVEISPEQIEDMETENSVEQVKNAPEANEEPNAPDTPAETSEVVKMEGVPGEEDPALASGGSKLFAIASKQEKGMLRTLSSNVLGLLGLKNEDN